MPAMIEAVERERHPVDLLLAFHRPRPLRHMGMRLALPAVEGVGALATPNPPRQHVPANPIGRRQIVEIRMPPDRLPLPHWPPRPPQRKDQGRSYYRQDRKKGAHENKM